MKINKLNHFGRGAHLSRGMTNWSAKADRTQLNPPMYVVNFFFILVFHRLTGYLSEPFRLLFSRKLLCWKWCHLVIYNTFSTICLRDKQNDYNKDLLGLTFWSNIQLFIFYLKIDVQFSCITVKSWVGPVRAQ